MSTRLQPPPSPPSSPSSSAARASGTETDPKARLLAAIASGRNRINFGCGDHPLPSAEGWVNIDNGDGEWYGPPKNPAVIPLDIFEALEALPDACASVVYSEHVFEHFTLQQGHVLLAHWRRILRGGGVVRIVCPDLEAESRLYLRQIQPASDTVIDAHRARWLDDRSPLRPGESLTRAMVLNAAMRLDGHKFIYDFETISQSLRLAGFESVVRERFGHSRHGALRKIDRHDGGETGRSWVPSMALVVEATCPPPPNDAKPQERPAPIRHGGSGQPPTALERARAELESLQRRVAAADSAREAIRRRLIDAVAERCAAAGYRRIALFGAGRHTVPIVRQPWAWRDVRVVAILDDDPKVAALRGVPLMKPEALREAVDAVVVSSDSYERILYERATAVFGPRGIPVLRIYGEAPEMEPPERTLRRLVERMGGWGLSDADARWLVENRAERHDATLPILPPQRTELHLRRYEFAMADGRAAGKRVLDAACGTGYGSAMLMEQGGAGSVVGIDIDPRAVDYATRRHGRPGVTFRVASAADTGLAGGAAGSVDLVVSFETIEHMLDPAAMLGEFARVLAPGGTLVLSTPNDKGLTDHHVHSFTSDTLAALLSRSFHDVNWFGQSADPNLAPWIGPPAAGITPQTSASETAETLLIVARRRG